MTNRKAYESPAVVHYGSVAGLTGNTTLTCSSTYQNKTGSNPDDVTSSNEQQLGTWHCV